MGSVSGPISVVLQVSRVSHAEGRGIDLLAFCSLRASGEKGARLAARGRPARERGRERGGEGEGEAGAKGREGKERGGWRRMCAGPG